MELLDKIIEATKRDLIDWEFTGGWSDYRYESKEPDINARVKRGRFAPQTTSDLYVTVYLDGSFVGDSIELFDEIINFVNRRSKRMQETYKQRRRQELEQAHAQLDELLETDPTTLDSGTPIGDMYP